MIDINQAMSNPSAVFASPNEVVHHQELSRDQKLEILRQWAQDEEALQVAEDESMSAPQNQRDSRLDDVMSALHDLGEERDPAS